MLKIAHVGHLGPRSEHDGENVWIIYKWVMANLPELAAKWVDGAVEDDCIDLFNGRDFLKEDKQYDVVCILSIFHPQHKTRFDVFDQGTEFQRSPLHSIEAWQRRLTQTGAKYLFMLGGDTEISGDTLKEWGPYKIIDDREQLWLTAYQAGEISPSRTT